MKFGKDFWVALRMAFIIIQAILKYFGDPDEKEEAEKNGL